MRMKKDILMLAPAAGVAITGLVQGVNTLEADLGLSCLVAGIVVWVAILTLDRRQPEHTPRRTVVPFRGYREFVLVIVSVLACMILILLFGASLALILAVVEGGVLSIAICAMAVLVLIRVSIPQTKACIHSIRTMYRRTEYV